MSRTAVATGATLVAMSLTSLAGAYAGGVQKTACGTISVAVRNIEASSQEETRMESATALYECIDGLSAAQKNTLSSEDVDELADLLLSSDDGVRAAGAIALGNVGSKAFRALPRLRVALEESRRLKLGQIGPSVGSQSAILKAIEKITVASSKISTKQ